MKRKFNFRFKEFECPCCGDNAPISIELFDFINGLQDFRDWYLKPMNINCSYRCPHYNSSLKNASKHSNHLKGTAIDWNIRGIVDNMDGTRLREFREHIVEEWLKIGKHYGYHVEVEINPTWIHLAFNTNCDINFNRIGIASGAKNTGGSKFKNYYTQQYVK